MARFGLIGASGYIAPRHMEAVRNVGGELVTILDPNDSVGVIDRYHPKAKYFSEYERFDREVDRLKRMGKGLDYISIASPNYLHDAHIRFALKNGSHAICEKPLVLNPYSISSLEELQVETGKNIYPILQLRLHQSIIDLKEKVAKGIPTSDLLFNKLDNTIKEEALSALVALGFVKKTAETKIDKVLRSNSENISVEELVKTALSQM